MDINKIPLNRWTWWNMSICLYVCIYFYIYTRINYISTNLYSMSIYFFDIWEPKAFIYTFTQTNPFGLTFFESTLRCFRNCPQATGSPRKSNWPRAHQQRKPKLPPLNHRKWRSLNPMKGSPEKNTQKSHQEEPENDICFSRSTGN